MHLRTHVRPFAPVSSSRVASQRSRADRPSGSASSLHLHQVNNADAGTPPLRLDTARVGLQSVEPAANADTAIDVLTRQVQALLSTLLPLAQPEFRHAVRTPDATGDGTLTRTALATLLRALKAAPATPDLPPRQQMLRAALRDVARAADAELLLQEQIARHGRRQQANALPGSQTSTTTGGSVGAAFGLPASCTAEVAIAAEAQTSTATGEDLTVATLHTRTVRGDASLQAGLPAGVGVGGAASGYYSHGHADITASMRTHVRALAHASVARRLGGNRLTRSLRQLFGTQRDRYAERASRALAWQPRLQMLQVLPAHGGPAAPVPFATPNGTPIQATVSSVGGSLAANVGVGVGRLTLSGALARSTFVAALPTRLTALDDSGAARGGTAAVRAALAHRIAPLLDDARLRSPTLQQVRALRAAADGDADAVARLAAVDQLRSEFDHLEALVRHGLVAPHQSAPVLASLCRDWGSATAACEPVMIAMLDTLAWLQASPRPAQEDTTGRGDWSALQEAAATLGNRIHDTQLPHDRRRVHLATHGFREMTQRVTTQRGTLAVSATAMPAGLAATVSVARHVREDPDPVRAGTYLELTLRLDATMAIDALLADVQRHWPQGWEAWPAREVEEVLSALSPTLGSGVQCLVRLFKPAFQRDPSFPAAARGTHLQAVRLATATTRAFGVTLPLPLFPGVATPLGVRQQRATQHTRVERLCERTLTGTLLRYQSLCTTVRSNADTWAVLVASHGADLDRLCRALAQPDRCLRAKRATGCNRAAPGWRHSTRSCRQPRTTHGARTCSRCSRHWARAPRSTRRPPRCWAPWHCRERRRPDPAARCSGKQQALAPLRVGIDLVAPALMQAELRAVPELDATRHHAQPTPAFRSRHIAAGKTRFGGGHARIEFLARGQGARLQRRPRADLAHARARGEVGIGLAVADTLHTALDAHLDARFTQAAPQEQQRHLRVGLQLAALVAVQVGIEHETAFVEGLEQYRACRGTPAAVGGGHGHRVGFEFGTALGFLVQGGKGRQRFGMEIGHGWFLAARFGFIVTACLLLRTCPA
jgi:hypothetical protein